MNVCYQIIPQAEIHPTKEEKVKGKESSIAQRKHSIIRNSTKITQNSSTNQEIRGQKRGNKKHWRPQENLRYCQFLKQNTQLCSMSKMQKISYKLNVRMSEYIETKTPTQCRSHNQKMLIKFGDVMKIISGLQGKLLGQSKGEILMINSMQEIPMFSDSEQLYIEHHQAFDDSQIWNNLNFFSSEIREHQST